MDSRFPHADCWPIGSKAVTSMCRCRIVSPPIGLPIGLPIRWPIRSRTSNRRARVVSVSPHSPKVVSESITDAVAEPMLLPFSMRRCPSTINTRHIVPALPQMPRIGSMIAVITNRTCTEPNSRPSLTSPMPIVVSSLSTSLASHFGPGIVNRIRRFLKAEIDNQQQPQGDSDHA